MKLVENRTVIKRVYPIILASLLSACGGGGSDTDIVEQPPVQNPEPTPVEPETPVNGGERLLIAKPGDHDHIMVYDIDNKQTIADLHVDGTISGLYASPSNRYAIAVQGTQGFVNFIDSGVEWESHGDHGHLHLENPSVLNFSFTGTKPAHVTKHADQTVIFFDGIDGVPAEIRIVTESGIVDGITLASYSDNIHQHGAAQAWGEYLISTVRDGSILPATTLPSMVRIGKRSGDRVEDVEVLNAPENTCPGLHGSAQNQAFIVFGCNDGVLMLEPQGDSFHAHKLTNSSRISSLFGHPNLNHFIGAGRNTTDAPVLLFAVDPAAEAITPIAFDKTPRAYGFAEDGALFLILDTEGGLTALNTQNWTVEGARLQVTTAPEATGQTFRLTISSDGEHAYVADTGAQKILEIDVHEWTVDNEASVQLDFVPGPILWVGSAEEDSSHLH